MNYMSLYYYYLKNIFENQLDNFFCYFHNEDNLELSSLKLGIYELYDVFTYLFKFRFEEFFFLITQTINSYKKKNSYLFFFFFLISDLFSFLSFFLISHSWLSLKIYNDYVHNVYRRNILKNLGMFFLIFVLLFLFFNFYII